MSIKLITVEKRRKWDFYFNFKSTDLLIAATRMGFKICGMTTGFVVVMENYKDSKTGQSIRAAVCFIYMVNPTNKGTVIKVPTLRVDYPICPLTDSRLTCLFNTAMTDHPTLESPCHIKETPNHFEYTCWKFDPDSNLRLLHRDAESAAAVVFETR